MNRRIKLTALTGALTLALTGLLASSAFASFHLNRIREVHYGGANNDYVVLQASAAGQNFTAGSKVQNYDGGGNPMGNPVVLGNVANGANNATILAGGTAVPGADATAAGFTVVFNGSTCLLAPDGSGLDCVSYGLAPIVPLPSPAGTPVSLSGGGLSIGQSILRTISRGCATQLDAPDDTNDSSADFAAGTPNPRNNAAPITEKPCTSAPPVTKKKCKKHKKKKGAYSAKKKKCKKKHKK
jgi:hypothetical protein